MVIFIPKCRKKHPQRECPLNSVEKCTICELNHATSSCPSLPGLKVVFQRTGEEMETLYFMGPKKPWQPRSSMGNQGMFPDPSQYFSNFNMGPQSMPYPPMWPQYQFSPWQQWAPQASSSSSWAPNWQRPSPPVNFPSQFHNNNFICPLMCLLVINLFVPNSLSNPI